MAFLTDEAALAQLLEVLQIASPGAANSKWLGIANRARLRAEAEIVTALAARGYTPAQVAAWDRAAEVAGDLSTYYGLQLGGTLAKVADKETLARFDRQEELKTVQVTAGGKFVSPAGPDGQVGTGPLAGPPAWRPEIGMDRDGDWPGWF